MMIKQDIKQYGIYKLRKPIMGESTEIYHVIVVSHDKSIKFSSDIIVIGYDFPNRKIINEALITNKSMLNVYLCKCDDVLKELAINCLKEKLKSA